MSTLRGALQSGVSFGSRLTMETSYANGGQLSVSNAEVWNHWSTVAKGLRWMLRSDAPLLMNPRPSWHKYTWIAELAPVHYWDKDIR